MALFHRSIEIEGGYSIGVDRQTWDENDVMCLVVCEPEGHVLVVATITGPEGAHIRTMISEAMAWDGENNDPMENT